MLNKLRKEQGFTLIELLIVVAIIGILAAIAIPQFSAYRQKGFNAAAVADLKNAKTGQESLFADNQTYGWTENAALTAIVGTGGAGTLIQGPASGATTTTAGAVLAGLKPDPNVPKGIPAGAPIGISNGVNFYATTIAQVGSPAYVMASKHTSGTRVFCAESVSTAIEFVQAVSWAGVALDVGGAAVKSSTNTLVGLPAAPSTTTPSITSGTTAGGGDAPAATWSAM
jgi:type IV pilus assembly protein PilA